ncbi:ArdC family protein [Peptococcaceae bacterium]|nr:ArdC family protein [Peptococcaceae bacterium]
MNNKKEKIDRGKEILEILLQKFESGNLSSGLKKSFIRKQSGSNLPMDKWSFLNQLIAMNADTTDGRSFKAWQDAGRQVKKGAKAFYIIAPRMKKKKEINPKTGKEEIRNVVYGFGYQPKFRYEDTQGAEVNTPDYTPPELPPLMEIADRFGIKQINYLPLTGQQYAGNFRASKGEINLLTHEHAVWYHELGHAVHANILGVEKFTEFSTDAKEIVAELFAGVMMSFHGDDSHETNVWEYIQRFIYEDKNVPKAALKKISTVLSDVEKCLVAVFDAQEKEVAA